MYNLSQRWLISSILRSARFLTLNQPIRLQLNSSLRNYCRSTTPCALIWCQIPTCSLGMVCRGICRAHSMARESYEILENVSSHVIRWLRFGTRWSSFWEHLAGRDNWSGSSCRLQLSLWEGGFSSQSLLTARGKVSKSLKESHSAWHKTWWTLWGPPATTAYSGRREKLRWDYWELIVTPWWVSWSHSYTILS